MLPRNAILPILPALLLASCDPVSEPRPDVDEPFAPRIVVIAPSAAEMLEGIGMLDRVVGVGDFVTAPDAVADLPRVGSYDAPNVERILELRANLVISTSGDAASASHQRLRDLEIEVIDLDTSTYDGVFASLRELGARLHREAEARELEESILTGIDSVRRRASNARRRRVLFVVGRDPLYVAGPGSHLDELIGIAGGENVAHDALSPYQMVSMESMLQRMPEVIIDTSDNRPGAVRGRMPGPWARWKFLPAVKNDRVYHVDPDRLVIPGIRLPDMADLTGRMIHPEIFGEDDGAAP
jgi:iron complex transport system substrate-binding protein